MALLDPISITRVPSPLPLSVGPGERGESSFDQHLRRAAQSPPGTGESARPAPEETARRDEPISSEAPSRRKASESADSDSSAAAASESHATSKKPEAAGNEDLDTESNEPTSEHESDDSHEPTPEELAVAAAAAAQPVVTAQPEQPAVTDELVLSVSSQSGQATDAEAAAKQNAKAEQAKKNNTLSAAEAAQAATNAKNVDPKAATDDATQSPGEELVLVADPALPEATGEEATEQASGRGEASLLLPESSDAVGDDPISGVAVQTRDTTAAANKAVEPVQAEAANNADTPAGSDGAEPLLAEAAGTSQTLRRPREATAADRSEKAAESTNEAAAGDSAGPSALDAPPGELADAGANRDETGGQTNQGSAENIAAAIGENEKGSSDRFGNLLGTRGLRQADGSNLSEADRVRFVQRVAKAFQSAEEQGGQLRVRLSPPELGAMKLEITIRAGVMTARMETETATARNVLLDNLPALRERLAQQDIKVARFDVDLMGQSPEGHPGRPQDQQQRQGQRAIAANRVRAAAEHPTTTSVAAAKVRSGSASGLNIII